VSASDGAIDADAETTTRDPDGPGKSAKEKDSSAELCSKLAPVPETEGRLLAKWSKGGSPTENLLANKLLRE